ncbi:MAG: hypothetical protein M0Z64_01020 [Nitrospiraceae bacterium]|nr:hypothetical protein [Nitrospiraceae bacterium]
MDQQIAFAAKEEILRNTIKTHNHILVSGWEGAGKTVTALKAGKGFGDVYYYSESGIDIQPYTSRYNDTVRVLKDMHDFNAAKSSDQPLLIVDDLDKISADTLNIIISMLSEKTQNRKIILIARTLMDVEGLLSEMDAVVRLKHDTAEILFSTLKDINNI